MRNPVAGSQSTSTVGRDPASAVDAQRTKRDGRLGRAYRAGRLVCGWVHVTISVDERLGLTQQERRRVRLRFHEPLDDGLRSELAQLMRRRGAAARRAAERIDPIEIVVDDPGGEREHIVGSRLSADEIVALKFAAHRQLSRWASKAGLSTHQHAQRAALKRAVHVLQNKTFTHGCELQAPSAEGEE